MINKRGSIWGKWDLHLHTPATLLNNSFEGDQIDDKWDNFFKALEESDIEVIGITNYFCLEGYLEVLKAKGSGRLKNIKLILPNIEFRLSESNHKGEHINLHIIFSNRVSTSKIEDCLNRLALSSTSPDGKKKYCNTEDLTEIGLKNATINREDLISLLTSDFIPIKDYLILVPSGGYGGIHPKDGEGREATLAIEYDKISHAFFGNSTDVNFYLNKQNERFQGSIPKPVLDTSDAHDTGKIGSRFTWIKSAPTYEGLKQILFEPEGRVKHQVEHPDQKIDYLIIDKVKFVDITKKKIFYDDWIELNPNLNTVIGGKSSGKSLLLFHIARTIDPEQARKKIKFCELEKIFNRVDDLEFEILWRDGVVQRSNDEVETKNRRITYIPQMYINKLVEEEGYKGLYGLILNVLLQNNEFKRFYSAKKYEISEVFQKLSTLVNELFTAQTMLVEIKAELKEHGDKKAIKGEIEKAEAEIKEIGKRVGFSQEESKTFEKLKKKIEDDKAKRSKLIRLIKVLNNFKFDLLKLPNEIEQSIRNIISNLLDENNEISELDSLLTGISGRLIPQINDLIMKNVTKEFEPIKSYLAELKELGLDIIKAGKELAPLLAKFKNQEQLIQIQKRLQDQQVILSQFESLEKKLKLQETKKEGIILKLSNEYSLLMDKYLDVVKEISKKEYRTIGKDISLTSELTVNSERFDSNFSDKLNKKSKLNSISGFWNDSNEFVFNLDNHIVNFVNTINKLLDGEVKLKSGHTIKDAVEALSQDYFEIKYDLMQRDDTIFQMSPGKRGLILLELILQLSNSTHPILIDQPEDNLDNRTVYNDLNDFIRQKKLDRQIIIVTHNANLAVSTDAEEVIVANQSGEQIDRENREFRFEYVSGALECTFKQPSNKGILFQKGIKEHVCEILEGGEEAFKHRQEKYALSNL